ncbi:hypothetical protein HSX11_08220 [Oxalobacteraceae bacterium]|nr:hypothetical protein [Oxalobacteraceae bacterium]
MGIVVAIVFLAFAGMSGVLWQRQQLQRREAYVRSFTLPKGLFDKLREQHPDLTLKDCQLVAQGLRQFFLAHLKSGRKFVSMPSLVADDLWHEFILYTRNYQQFCQQAFGRFLHHTPAVVLSKGQQGNAGIKRCWHFACHEENINPKKPSRLPLLFALDSKLHILNGFVYVADCSGFARQGDGVSDVYCAAEIGSSGSGCGGGDSDSGFSSSSDSSSDSGSGDSGVGCGGGGCGGGGD